MAKKPPASSGFNNPFRDLKPPAPVTPPGKTAKGASVSAPAAVPAKARPLPAAPPARATGATSADDDQLFAQAMRGVTPLSQAQRAQRATPLAEPPRVPDRAAARAQARREDADADADMSELVARPGRLTVEEVGEAASGWADGVDRRLLRRLGAGDYPVDVTIDLHGLSRDAAAGALDRALRRAASDGQRCLLVIHGRGLNSGDDGPVLKRMVLDELGGGALGRLVLAFTSAPPSAGGTGALLVLLRRARA